MMNHYELSIKSGSGNRIERTDSRRYAHGFTLIELMIAVVIVGIIAAIAYPSYQQHVYKARRAEAKVALTDVAQKLERCYSNQLTYVGCPTAPTQAPQYYRLNVVGIGVAGYTITATPINAQAGDTQCATFIIDQLTKGALNNEAPPKSTTDACW